jgi:DNA primase
MPLFSDSVLDEVRNSVNIVSVVSEYVALRKRGRSHLARCPFHTEKTPSFNVHEEKQIFHCFGCGVGGDVFKFLTLIEHISFPEAVRLLASRSGIVLAEPEPRFGAREEFDADVLRAAMTAACDFFHETLQSAGEGRVAKEYLERRGISRETIARCRLGYSPGGGEALLGRLKGSFTLQNLLDCGLVKQSDDGGRHYDAFRARVMFPIADIQSRIIAFGGRTLGDAQPKYLNSPETRLYNKSRNLYGLSLSREAIKRADFAVLVEGYMDFLVPFQAGVENVVASLGTSLTPQQVKLLGRYTRDVVVSYDPDSAGVSAAARSLDMFLEEDFKVRVLRLPSGQDPDAFIRSAGVDEYRARLRDATPYLDFVLETALDREGKVDGPRKKVQVLNSILPYLAKVPNAIERSDYAFQIGRKLGIDDRLMLAELRKAAQQRKPQMGVSAKEQPAAMKFAEKRLLQLLLGFPELQFEVLPNCLAEDYAGLATERIFSAVLVRFKQGEAATYEDLHRQFASEPEQALVTGLQMEEVPESPSRDNAESFLNALRKMRLASYKQQLVSKIAEAAGRKDEGMLSQLREQSIRVDRELVSLSRK